jgi:hypothetical protein
MLLYFIDFVLFSLWPSGQSCWLQIQRSWVWFPTLPDFLTSSGLERGPLSLVSTTEELRGRNSSGSGLEIWEYGRRDPSDWPCDALYPQKFALTSLASGGRSVGIVRSKTKATEFALLFSFYKQGCHMNRGRENLPGLPASKRRSFYLTHPA